MRCTPRVSGRFFQNIDTLTTKARLDSVFTKIEEEQDVTLEGFQPNPQCQTGSARFRALKINNKTSDPSTKLNRKPMKAETRVIRCVFFAPDRSILVQRFALKMID